MPQLAPNTPVIIGVGFRSEKSENPLDCPEPYRLMLDAIGAAADDAGNRELLTQFESVSVQQGMWQYSNPARLIAAELGCDSARTILSDLGVLQLKPLFDLCQAIAAGEQELGVVTGGEAKYRELRSAITGIPVSNTEQTGDLPDAHLDSQDPFATDVEAAQGIFLPTELFAVIESALRHHKGLDVDEHRDQLAQLYSSFSAIAAANPHAWNREVVSAEAIRNPIGKNAMLAFPYTKKHNSQWNVNTAVAIIVCSAGKARQLGLDDSKWIYPLAGAASGHVVCLAQQRTLYSHAGTIIAGQRAYELAGIGPQDISHADLYSCFPAAIQSFALDLQLENVCPWTVTGSMAFSGGPYNHAALDGVARMVEVLRAGNSQQRYGLVSNLSGIFGKQGVTILSNHPGPDNYRFEDVTVEVAQADPPLPVTGTYVGPATVVGYTVSYNKEEITQGFAYCDTPTGERTVAKSVDRDLLEAMTREEYVGREIEIDAQRLFSLPG